VLQRLSVIKQRLQPLQGSPRRFGLLLRKRRDDQNGD
jgi:hypothetical protein